MPRYTYTDPLSLPRLDADGVKRGGQGVLIEGDGRKRRFVRAAPAFIDDPDGAGLFAGLGAVPVIYPPAFTLSLRDATLAGYRSLLCPDGRLLQDDAPEPEVRARLLGQLGKPDPFLNEDTGLRATGTDGVFAWDAPPEPPIWLDGSTAVLASTEPSNYGSFLFRVLPKLIALRHLAPASEAWRVLAPSPGTTGLRLLELAGIPPDRLMVHQPHLSYRIAHAVAPGQRNNQAFLDPATRELFAELRDRAERVDDGALLYVSRHRLGRAGRVMGNEAALIEALAARGFRVIEPETMPIERQIAAFAAARIVVGPAGSGLFNCVFCRPGTMLIDLESEPFWIHAHACLFTSCGLRFGLFLGQVDATDPAPVHRRWSVNIPALLDRLRKIDAGIRC